MGVQSPCCQSAIVSIVLSICMLTSVLIFIGILLLFIDYLLLAIFCWGRSKIIKQASKSSEIVLHRKCHGLLKLSISWRYICNIDSHSFDLLNDLSFQYDMIMQMHAKR